MNQENGPESNDEGKNMEVKKARTYSDKPFKERRAEKAAGSESEGNDAWAKRSLSRDGDSDRPARPARDRESSEGRPERRRDDDRGESRGYRGDRSESRGVGGRSSGGFSRDRDRGSRPSFGDRKPRFGSSDRDSRPSFGDRKPRFGSSDRDSRPAFGDRKPSFGSSDRDSRPAFGDRKPAFGSSDRGDRASSPDRRFERRDDSRSSSPFRREGGRDDRERSDKRGDNWAPERRAGFGAGRSNDDRKPDWGKGESNRDGFQRRKREDDSRGERPERNSERGGFRGERNDDRGERSSFRGERSEGRPERTEFRDRGGDRRPDRKTEGPRDENTDRRPYGERGGFAGSGSRPDRAEGEERRSNFSGNDRDAGSSYPSRERSDRGGEGRERSSGGFRDRNSGGDRSSGGFRERSSYGDRSSGGERSSGRREGFVRSENYGRNKTDSSFKKKSALGSENLDGVRLNKFIANSGICSRREADELIAAGTIAVNGVVITEMGHRIKQDDVVTHEGAKLRSEKMVYVLLNKPKDFITTTDDPGERKTVMSLVADACRERIYPVGRLDRNTTGLLLLTNDGELTKKLTHPSYQVRKMYHVELDKNLKLTDMDKLSEGIELEDGLTSVDSISYVGDSKSEVGLELHSGKNRIVRRMFESMDYEVKKLDRVAFAGLTKKDLPRGRWRFLTEMEVNMLSMVTGKATV